MGFSAEAIAKFVAEKTAVQVHITLIILICHFSRLFCFQLLLSWCLAHADLLFGYEYVQIIEFVLNNLSIQTFLCVNAVHIL